MVLTLLSNYFKVLKINISFVFTIGFHYFLLIKLKEFYAPN